MEDQHRQQFVLQRQEGRGLSTSASHLLAFHGLALSFSASRNDNCHYDFSALCELLSFLAYPATLNPD